MRTILLVLIMIFSKYSFGQLPEFLNNKNIEVLAETKIEYILEKDESSLFYKPLTLDINGILVENKTKTIKIDYLESCDIANKSNRFLTEKLINLALDGRLVTKAIIDDRKLSQEEIIKALEVVDTVITFNPINYEEQVEIVGTVRLSAIQSLKISQYWLYDFTKEQFFVIPYEVIPVIRHNGKKKRGF